MQEAAGPSTRMMQEAMGPSTRSLLATMRCPSTNAPVDDEANDLSLPGGYDAGERTKSIADRVEELQSQTFLNPAELRELERADPRFVEWLRSSTGFLVQIALFTLFVGMDAAKSLFVGKALKGTSVISTSVVIMSSFASIFIGLAVALGIDGIKGCAASLSPRTVKRFSVVAFMFAVAQCFQTLSYTVLSPGMIKIFGQIRLLQTALLSMVFLNRRYIGAQWSVMFIIVMAAVMFMEGKVGSDEIFTLEKNVGLYVTDRTNCENALMVILQNRSGAPLMEVPSSCAAKLLKDPTKQESTNMLVGLLYIAIYLLLSDVGSILSEKFLKDESSTPFYVQKVAIELSGFPVAILMSVCIPLFQEMIGVPAKVWSKDIWWTGTHLEPPKTGIEVENSIFQGWGYGAYLALFFNCIGSWLSGMVVKRMSSVMKLLGKVLSLGVVYFLGDCLFMKVDGREPPMICTLAQFVVMAATYAFMNIKAPESVEKNLPTPPPLRVDATTSVSASHIEMHPNGVSKGGGVRV